MTFRDWLTNLFEGVIIALDAIRSNKVRAGLTILGIAVGVFVVTVMSAAVHGINEGVSKSIAAAGPTTFFLTRWPAEITSCDGSADSCPWRRNPPLTLTQGKEIEQLPFIRGVVAHQQLRVDQVRGPRASVHPGGRVHPRLDRRQRRRHHRRS